MKSAGDQRGRTLVTTLVVLVVLAAGVVLVSTALAGIGAVNDVTRLFAGSKVVLITDRTNLPIVKAERMLPGDRAAGVIKVGNFGTRPGVLYAKPRRVADKAGPNGGHLSWRLMLRVQELKKGGRTRTVWYGRIDDFKRVRLGVLKAGKTKRYRFTAHFRMRPPVKSTLSANLLMGSSFKTDWVFELKPKR
jgi:hypothetical protein